MDPDANLVEQRRLSQDIIYDELLDETKANRLAELVQALDEWIKGGGFLPKAWQKNPSKST
jgi:hypothetical protein